VEHEDISAKNTLNELTGAEWLYFTKSILTTTYPSEYGHQLRKAHGANKPPQLMSQLIEFFTKAGGRVLDPFAGVGGTLIGASICKKPRNAVGIEINPKWIAIYNQVLREEKGQLQPQQLLQGDCLDMLPGMEPESFDFIVTDPPYNIHLAKTMSNNRYADLYTNRRTDYDMRSEDPSRISQATTIILMQWSRYSVHVSNCSNHRNTWQLLSETRISMENTCLPMLIWRVVPNSMALFPRGKSSGTRQERVSGLMAILLPISPTLHINISLCSRNQPGAKFVLVLRIVLTRL
jgi:16S rRNA G966 N2-methylase RsmD